MRKLPQIDVIENEDNSLTIQWDETHPNFAFLNSMTNDEREKWFTEAITKSLDELDRIDLGYYRWMNEIESFSLRIEKAKSDMSQNQPYEDLWKEIQRWLMASYKQGYYDGLDR